MSSFVLGCSVAVAWLLEDERVPGADALLDRLERGGQAVVPGLWRLELGNVLAGAERRGRIGATGIARCLGLLARLPIATDRHTEERALREILELARRDYLTTYDAVYLELAMRRGLPLATLGRSLARAARRAGVEVLPG
ncbi:MAG: type II toxin-antitoxin system VapC family toxin [Gemmatimonadota bacterium]|nr:type II toxin-antitoxin system VapC family toxin [Gemmatimonadota bacterium]MDE2870311.1 type II toxin-antitoxin system VapC family toxin [Gemmatimonadota bacterium]